MPEIYLSPLGEKAQITLPKAVRKALGLREKDLVGFFVERNRVAVSRIEPLSSSDPFTKEEWAKIRKLASRPPRAVFQRSEDSMDYLKRHLKAR